MDLSIYLNMMNSAAWYLIPIFIFAIVIKSAWFKGVLGEWQVNLLIKFFLNKNEYHLIKNVTLPTEDGTTQIDHIIVSKYGIFVVETKNMKGWIFGNGNQKQWTQQIYKHKSKFQNPLHQNYKHVKTLEACLNAKNDSIFSVIIFIGDSTFKTNMPENVRFARGGIEYIKSKTEIVFNAKEVASVIGQIENGMLERSYKTNGQHIKHVKEIIEEKSNIKACSKCGADMMLCKVSKVSKVKNADNEFWGCSSFPKCRNVEVIN
ncbi:MAG TPA: nuclease [Colwellia sp.]|nr:nuclease [Colwellia sp.]|tara:strand:+ start:2815 stop:3600 length:786 start_codon:yes stop_codon:yes gene_type:complete